MHTPRVTALLGLALLSACGPRAEEPAPAAAAAASTKSSAAAETPPPVPFEAGAASLTFESPLTAGPTTIELGPEGVVSIAGEAVGSLDSAGRYVLDGTQVGTLEASTYTLAGFAEPLELSAEAKIEQGGALYAGWSPEGELIGAMMDETPGAKARVSGDPERRREMLFLLMASTVARGPGLANKPVAPVSAERSAACQRELEAVYAAMAAGDLDGLIARVALPFFIDGEALDEAALRAKLGPELEARAASDSPAPTVVLRGLDSATELSAVVPGVGDALGFNVELESGGRTEGMRAAFVGEPPKLVGLLDR